MKKVFILLSIAALFILAESCNDEIVSSKINSGFFSYTEFDSLGNLRGRGQLNIFVNDTLINGTWKIQRKEFAEGELEGRISNSEIIINLNPGFVDHNTYLIGNFDRNKIKGKWQAVGYQGVFNYGTFKAIK